MDIWHGTGHRMAVISMQISIYFNYNKPEEQV